MTVLHADTTSGGRLSVSERRHWTEPAACARSFPTGALANRNRSDEAVVRQSQLACSRKFARGSRGEKSLAVNAVQRYCLRMKSPRTTAQLQKIIARWDDG